MIVGHCLIQQYLVDRGVKLSTDRRNNSEKLSSGVKVNRAADNCSGLAVYNDIHTRLRGIDRANRNTQDGISMLQVIDGGIRQSQEDLHRIKELTVQSLNGTLTSDDKDKIQEEIDQLKKNLNDLSDNTEFNQIKVLNQDADIKIKILDDPEVNFNVHTYNTSAKALGLDNLNVKTEDAGNKALSMVDNALDKVSGYLVKTGASENALNEVHSTLDNMSYNFNRSESNINDTDVAEGAMEDVRVSILQQATDAMFNQAGNIYKKSVDVLYS